MPFTYEEVKKLSERTDAAAESSTPILIDVRGPDEVAGGMIPTAYHIILDEVAYAFSPTTDDATFASKYGFPKPQPTDAIVFYCRSGRRVVPAAAAAKEAGYSNVDVYPGSWLDWQAHAIRVS